jgi:hypothetical protein
MTNHLHYSSRLTGALRSQLANGCIDYFAPRANNKSNALFQVAILADAAVSTQTKDKITSISTATIGSKFSLAQFDS